MGGCAVHCLLMAELLFTIVHDGVCLWWQVDRSEGRSQHGP